MDSLWKLLWHLLFVAVVFGTLAFLFRSVATPGVALAIAALFTVGELIALMLTGRHGGSLKTLAAVGIPVIAFPIIGWAVRLAFDPAWYVTLPIAAALACALGTLGARHGSGRDTRRLAEAGVAVAIPLYAMVLLVTHDVPTEALALGIVAVAVAPIVTKIAVTWPGHHEAVLVAASGVCVAWAALIAAVGWL